MKQKIIIGLSVVMLVSAVILIGNDLFRKSPSFTASCCGDEDEFMKRIDSSQIGYYRFKVIESHLKDLSGIAITGNQIFVCGNREVAVFDTTGTRVGGFHTDSANSCIAASGQIIYVAAGPIVNGYDLSGNIQVSFKQVNKNSYITSVTATSQFVFAADAVNKKVLKFTPDGTLVQVIGQKDSITGAPGFIIPSAYFDIAAGGFEDIWVVNPGRLEIENFTVSGQMRSSWGNISEDNGFTGCCNPAHIALLPNGSFITYEKGVDKIKLFDVTGRFVCYVAGTGSFRGKPDFQLGKNNLVKDLATDTKGNIYILDAYNRINIFRPIG